jgi:hypothetical protein
MGSFGDFLFLRQETLTRIFTNETRIGERIFVLRWTRGTDNNGADPTLIRVANGYTSFHHAQFYHVSLTWKNLR